MKKLFFAILAFALITIPIKAQNIPFKIQKSEIFTDDIKKADVKFTAADGQGGFVIIRTLYGSFLPFPKAYIIEHYDANFKLLNKLEHEISLTEEFIGLFVIDNKINIIERNYDRKLKIINYNCLSSNLNDFVITTKKLCAEALDLRMFQIQSLNKWDTAFNPIICFNSDKSSFAIIHEIKNKNAEQYKFFVFDSNLNQKFSQEFTREIKDKKFNFENIALDKDGNSVYLLGKVFVDQNKDKGGNYQYELSKISTNGVMTQIIDTQEHFMNSLTTIFLENKIVCVGLYSDRKEYRCKGLSYIELDPASMKINQSKYSPFTTQFLEDKYGSSDVKEKDKDFKFIDIKGIFYNSNNEIILNAEETYKTSHPLSGYNQMTSEANYVYHYDDIMSIKLNNQGELIWARNINKRQKESDQKIGTDGTSGYLSYTSVLIGENNYIFINTRDEAKKISNDRIEFRQTGKDRSNLNVIRIDKNGNFDFQELLDDKENEMPFYVNQGITVQNTVIFLGRKGQEKQLLKITL